tara:strand:- start:4997 stop:5215 length:219 start_codon:yes stop_codon:yes gene_type:complete
MSYEEIGKKSTGLQKTEIVKRNSSRRNKWTPQKICLLKRRIYRKQKEELLGEIAEIIFDLSQKFSLDKGEAL